MLGLAGCAAPPPAPDDARSPAQFLAWRSQQSGALAPFERFLRGAALDRVVPLHELLRTASDWQRCRAAPWAVPPQPQWDDVAGVLRLLQRLRDERVVGRFEAHSGWRDAALNACAGGAPRSAHLRSFALDLTPRDPPTAPLLPGLCGFWREHGPALGMGLGLYPSGRLHVDRAGWRSWGADGSARSSPCRADAAAAAAAG